MYCCCNYKDLKFGCHIGSRLCGSFGYADDICIFIAPSRKATPSMLDICQNVASEYYVKCNVSKTQLLLNNCPVNVDVISLKQHSRFLRTVFILVTQSAVIVIMMLLIRKLATWYTEQTML